MSSNDSVALSFQRLALGRALGKLSFVSCQHYESARPSPTPDSYILNRIGSTHRVIPYPLFKVPTFLYHKTRYPKKGVGYDPLGTASPRLP